jgi:thymidine phosphorylase
MKVAIGETIAMLYTDNKNAINEASEIVKESYKFCGYPPEIKPLILAYVDSKHVYKYGGKNN